MLTAPVDLLWNGGIGTYIKASHRVATPTSATRPTTRSASTVPPCGAGSSARAATSAATQRGRIEAATAGVKLNTDAIDNSAGVDTSDHEVNIKILLDQVVPAGRPHREAAQRAARRHDRRGGRAGAAPTTTSRTSLLGNARGQAPAMIPVHQRLIRDARGARRPGPRDRVPARPTPRSRRGTPPAGGSRPRSCRCCSPTRRSSSPSSCCDRLRRRAVVRSWAARVLPDALVERFERPARRAPAARRDHHLRRGQRHGQPGRHRPSRSARRRRRAPVRQRCCGRTPWPERCSRCRDFWARVEALDDAVPTAAQTALLLESRRLLDRATRWILQARGGTVDVEAEIERFRGDVARIAARHPGDARRRPSGTGCTGGRPSSRRSARRSTSRSRRPGSSTCSAMLDCVDVARATGADASEVAELYFVLSERYEVDNMLNRITALPRGDRWTALARAALRSDLYGALVGMTRRVIETCRDLHDADRADRAWESQPGRGPGAGPGDAGRDRGAGDVRPRHHVGRAAHGPYPRRPGILTALLA